MNFNFRRRLDSLGTLDNPDESANRAGITSLNPVMQPNSALSQLASTPSAPQNNYPTPMLDQYSDFISHGMPNEANYRPGKFTRAMAGLGSLGTSPQEAMMWQENTLHGPYNRAVGDYITRAKLMGEGAGIEERKLTNQRGIANMEAAQKLRDEANKIREEHESFLRDKSNQINEVQWAKLINQSEQKMNELQQKYDALAQKATSGEELNKISRERIEMTHDYYRGLLAAGARRASDTEAALEETKRRNSAYIQRLQELGEPVETTTTLENLPGNKGQRQTVIRGRQGQTSGVPNRFDTSTKGKKTVKMIGQDNKEYEIPEDMINDAITNKGMRLSTPDMKNSIQNPWQRQ